MPEWYVVIKAARYLGVAPWDLVGQHPNWQTWALWGLSAETEGETVRAKRAQRQQPTRRR